VAGDFAKSGEAKFLEIVEMAGLFGGIDDGLLISDDSSKASEGAVCLKLQEFGGVDGFDGIEFRRTHGGFSAVAAGEESLFAFRGTLILNLCEKLPNKAVAESPRGSAVAPPPPG
jgi:hypothetical protein